MADPDIVTTAILGLRSPKENLDPWWDKYINAQMADLDKWINRALTLGQLIVDLDTGAPSIVWNGSSVTFDNFYIISPAWGQGRLRVTANSQAISDGYSFVGSLPQEKIDGDVDITGYSTTQSYQAGQIPIWRRSGSILHWMLPIAQSVPGV